MLLLLTGTACTKSVPQAPVVIPAFDGTILTSPAEEQPAHFTRALLRARRERQSQPLVISQKTFQSTALVQPDGTAFNLMSANVAPFPAENYTECKVRLTTSNASKCRLLWQTDLDPSLQANPDIEIPLIADGAAHDYSFSLNNLAVQTWAGTVNQIAIAFGPKSASAVLESATFTYTPPEGPARVTLDNLTMEAAHGTQAIWDTNPNAGAVFETYVGLMPRASEIPGADGVIFRVWLADSDGKPAIAAETTVLPEKKGPDNRWKRLSFDFGNHVGHSVKLLMQTVPNGTSAGDYAVWGNPTVSQQDKSADATPVILISCDTLRADHVSCYGYERETTPHLDALAKDAVVFDTDITPETWTLTAHVAMLTGLHPIHHAVTANTNLSESVRTLPDILRDNGYATAGFVGHQAWMLPWRGLAFGFDYYSTPAAVRTIFETGAVADAWRKLHPTQRFFMFWHNYDIHSRFDDLNCKDCDKVYFPPDESYLHFSKEVPEPPSLRREGRAHGTGLLWALLQHSDHLTPEELAYLESLYDDCIHAVDSRLGEFFDQLKAEGIYDKALIIVTADHGEQFGEHDQFMHVHVYEGAAHVPLIVKFPKNEFAGQLYKPMVQTMDILPTVLDVLGLPPQPCDGQSLRALLNGKANPLPNSYIRRMSHRAVRNDEWKLVRDVTDGSTRELYHLSIDSAELANVAADNPEIVTQLTGDLQKFFVEDPQGWHIVFHSPDPAWRGVLTATTGDRFKTAKLLYGAAMGEPNLLFLDAQKAIVNLGIVKRDDLLLKTASPTATIELTITSESQFAVTKGTDQPFIGKQYQTILDSTAPPQTKESTSSDQAVPTLSIRYVAPTEEGSQALPLTKEQQDTLKGLGYLGS